MNDLDLSEDEAVNELVAEAILGLLNLSRELEKRDAPGGRNYTLTVDFSACRTTLNFARAGGAATVLVTFEPIQPKKETP